MRSRARKCHGAVCRVCEARRPGAKVEPAASRSGPAQPCHASVWRSIRNPKPQGAPLTCVLLKASTCSQQGGGAAFGGTGYERERLDFRPIGKGDVEQLTCSRAPGGLKAPLLWTS